MVARMAVITPFLSSHQDAVGSEPLLSFIFLFWKYTTNNLRIFTSNNFLNTIWRSRWKLRLETNAVICAYFAVLNYKQSTRLQVLLYKKLQNRFQLAPMLNLNDLKSKTAPLPNISVFDFHGNYCYNLCSLSCISCMLKFVYVLMGHMAYCMNMLLTYVARYQQPCLTSSNPCINKAIHMLLMHGFAVLQISIPGSS